MTRGRPPKTRHPAHPFARAILAWIHERGLTQKEAAGTLGVSTRTVARWLREGPYPRPAAQKRFLARTAVRGSGRKTEEERKAAFRKLSMTDKLGFSLAETRHMAEGLFKHIQKNGICNGDLFEVIGDVAVAHDRLLGAIRHFKDRYGIEIPVKEVEL